MPAYQGIPPEHLSGIHECLMSQKVSYPHSVSTPGAVAEAKIHAAYIHETFPSLRCIVDVGACGGHFPMAWLGLGLFAIGIDPHPDGPATLGAPILLRDAGIPLDVVPQADAVVSWDCAEHLPESKADGLIRNLCAMAPLVFFSSDDKPGAHGHVNCKPAEWWERLFAENGYYRATHLKPPRGTILWEEWRAGLRGRIEAVPPHESYLYWVWTDASFLYVRASSLHLLGAEIRG